MAHTSNIRNAGADAVHKIRLQAKHLSSTRTLTNLPGNDYLENKGDLWKLHLKDFFGFTTCITVPDIQEISILQGNNDEWNIKSIVTFAVVNQSEWEMTSADFNVLNGLMVILLRHTKNLHCLFVHQQANAFIFSTLWHIHPVRLMLMVVLIQCIELNSELRKQLKQQYYLIYLVMII